MDYSPEDFLSVNHLLSNITSLVDDEEYNKGFSRGWFVSRVQKALQEMAFDSRWMKVTKDLDFPKETLAMDMPANGFNMRNIYLFSCSCNPLVESVTDDTIPEACTCFISGSVNVYWKRLYNNKRQGLSHTAKIRQSGNSFSDPYVDPHHHHTQHGASDHGSSLYYANIQNGVIMFSPDSQSFNKVRLEYDGAGVEVGEIPSVPRFFEAYVVDFVKSKYWESRVARNPRTYVSLMNNAKNDLRQSHMTARKRITSMSTFEKESMFEYIGSLQHK